MADSLEQRVQAFIEDWAMKVQDSAIKVVDETVNYSGGQSADLSSTIKTNVAVTGSGKVRFTLSMADYYKFIEMGRGKNKKAPPTKPIEDFIRKRGIKPTMPKTLKGKKRQASFDTRVKSLAFVIARSIGKNGIKPRPFIDKIVTPELKKELNDGLVEAFKQQFIIDLKTL